MWVLKSGCMASNFLYCIIYFYYYPFFPWFLSYKIQTIQTSCDCLKNLELISYCESPKVTFGIALTIIYNHRTLKFTTCEGSCPRSHSKYYSAEVSTNLKSQHCRIVYFLLGNILHIQNKELF